MGVRVIDVVLTAGRDGNIHIYDLRCTGVFSSDLGIEESRYNRGRASYGAFWDQARISPVMSVRNAHGVGGGCGRKVTSVSREHVSLGMRVREETADVSFV
jgi:hypothetical protein